MNRRKQFIVFLFAVALALTPMSAAWGDTTSGEMIASNQKNVNVGDSQRIDSFTLDNTFNYQSLGNDSGKPTYTLNSSNIQEIVKSKLLPEWSKIATGVFRDQAGQLVDFYGYENNGGCMSLAGFNAYFDMSRGNNAKYKDETWSCWSLRDKLKQTYPSRAGEQNWDQFVVSGVKPISSQSDARKMMAESLHNIEKNMVLTTDDFLDAGEDTLSSLDDDTDTTGFANIVTAINCKGSSKEYDYTSFGIAFYDFEPVPVAAKHLKPVNGALSSDTDNKGTQNSDVENKQQQEILHSAMLGDSITETTSLNLSALASCELDQNMGANIGVSETESSSQTSFWSDDLFGSGSSTETSSSSVSMGMNWGAAWKMAGALGAEAGHSVAKEVSKAVETTIALPPHTATTVEHTTTTTTYTQNYQQPVVLNYKVAIFAMSGNCSGAGGGGIYDNNLYEKQSLVIKFDTKDKDSASYGCDATDDLYSRVVTNKNVPNYDSQQGRTLESHSTASRFSPSKGINWSSVESYISEGYKAPHVTSIAKQNYFYETPGKLTAEQDKTVSSAGALYPLYDLASVRTPKTYYVLYSNNTMDRDSLPLTGYDKDNVPFYGFDPDWGDWCLCDVDDNGNPINVGRERTTADPVVLDGETLKPNVAGQEHSNGGTIYLIWKFKAGAKAITKQSPDGQDLANANPAITTPLVRIDVVNIGLDNPRVTAEGSYIGYYKNPINLHNEMTYEVTDSDDVVLETQVYWESREPASQGISVNSGTGDVQFTKPGTYKVRPYVINNSNKKVYSDWLTVVATEHDLVHYDQKDPTCTDYGWIEHYRCAEKDCGKYFTDAEGKDEISKKDSLIDAIGHDWGEWTTTKEASGNVKGEQTRVCKNDESHVQKRDLFSVQFDANGHGDAPETQVVASGASVKVPQDPAATGYEFGGWFTERNCENAYDFGATVKEPLTLYAKWIPVKYTAAAMAVGDVTEDEHGEMNVDPVANGSITIAGGTSVTEDGYTYCFKEVEYGSPVTLEVTPEDGYGLKEITAIPIKADSSMGEPFTPDKVGNNKYSFTVPAADVAVLASFAKVTVTYDGNAPEGEQVSNVPAKETIPYGSAPTKVTGDANKPTVTGGYDFGGWFTDKACTKPYLKDTALTEDTTLYAKWIKDGTIKVTYTLTWERDQTDPNDTGEYTDNYQAEAGSKAYDPTEDLYDFAGMDLRAAYELKSDESGKYCWFTNAELTEPFDFNTPIEDATYLYATIVPREYTVTYYDVETKLGSQKKAYNKPIGEVAEGIAPATVDGHAFTGQWTTEDGAPWSIANNPVTSDLKLYAVYNDHVWGEWAETTPATIGAEGEETRVCEKNETHKETRSTDKVDPEPLNKAIKAAQDTEKGIKVSEDGKDIDPADLYTTAAEKKALDDAIAAAQKVVNKPESTQKDVDDAVAAVTKAKETYDAAKKPGKKEPSSLPTEEQMNKKITNTNTDGDLVESSFGLLKARGVSKGKKGVLVKWANPGMNTAKFVIYGNRCNTKGKKFTFVKLREFNANTLSYMPTDVNGMKLKKGTYYKFIVMAVDQNGRVVAVSKAVHVTTKGKKGNHKSVKRMKPTKKAMQVLSVGKSKKLKAKAVKGKKKVSKHRAIAWESSNPNVAVVSKKGMVTGKQAGTCTIYAYAQNGVYTTFQITVK